MSEPIEQEVGFGGPSQCASEEVSATALLAMFGHPARLGQRASDARHARVGDEVLVRRRSDDATAPPTDVLTEVERDGERLSLSAWPTGSDLRHGDRLVLWVEPEQREAFARWLGTHAVTLPDRISVAPASRTASGTHRAWLVGATRLVLGPARHVVARHDLLGTRVAQITLGFGASVLEGPWRAERRLPIAGVTRPDENTPLGLSALVEQAGLVPRLEDPGPT